MSDKIMRNGRIKRGRDVNSDITTENKRLIKKPKVLPLSSSAIQSPTASTTLLIESSTTGSESEEKSLLSESPVNENASLSSLSTSSKVLTKKSTSQYKVKDKQVQQVSLPSKMISDTLKVPSASKQPKLSTVDVKIIKTEVSIPVKKLEVESSDNNFFSSSESSNDKMTEESLYTQSVKLVLFLSILACIRMLFPALSRQNDSYLIVPLDNKSIGMKLRGSFMPEEVEINKPIVGSSIPISSQKSQSNYSYDDFNNNSGKVFIVGNSSLSYYLDDDIRHLLSSYSLPIATLPSYIENIETIKDQMNEDFKDIAKDMVKYEKEYEYLKKENDRIDEFKQEGNQDKYDNINECKNAYFYDMNLAMNSIYCTIDDKSIHDDVEAINKSLPRRKLFKTRWLGVA